MVRFEDLDTGDISDSSADDAKTGAGESSYEGYTIIYLKRNGKAHRCTLCSKYSDHQGLEYRDE